MRRISTAMLAAAALAAPGCATDYDLDNRMPDGRYVSGKTVEALTPCIVAGIRSRGAYQVERGETGTAITLRAPDGHPAVRITLRPTARGSVVLVRQSISYNMGPVIERCL